MSPKSSCCPWCGGTTAQDDAICPNCGETVARVLPPRAVTNPAMVFRSVRGDTDCPDRRDQNAA